LVLDCVANVGVEAEEEMSLKSKVQPFDHV
jgi:hypothetical protein